MNSINISNISRLGQKTRRNIAIAAATLGVSVAVIGGATVVSAQTGTTPAPHMKGQRAERHPELNKALRNLGQAENNLRHAASDFNGHKEKAIDLIHQAQRELQLAKQGDKG